MSEPAVLGLNTSQKSRSNFTDHHHPNHRRRHRQPFSPPQLASDPGIPIKKKKKSCTISASDYRASTLYGVFTELQVVSDKTDYTGRKSTSWKPLCVPFSPPSLRLLCLGEAASWALPKPDPELQQHSVTSYHF